MKAYEFMHEMRETSAILGRAHGISVVFEGDEAKTDGKTIYLPAFGLDQELTQSQILAMRGFVDHEAGHLRHSDLPRIISFYDKNRNNNRQELTYIHNSLEDTWMEERVVNEYQGAFKNLRQTNALVRGQERKCADAGQEIDPAMITAGSICATNPLYEDTEDTLKLREFFGEKATEMAKHYNQLARQCRNSDEVIELAKKIYQYSNQTEEEQQTPEDFDEKAQSGELSDLAGPEAEGENSPGYGKPQPGQGDAIGEKGVSDKLKDALNEKGEYSDQHHNDTGGIGTCVGDKGKDSYRVWSTKSDVVYERGGNRQGGDGTCWNIVNDSGVGHGAYHQYKGGITSNISVMKNKLRRAIMARQQRDWDFGRTIGRLDSKRLVAASAGVKEVYKRRTDRLDHDTAVTILVDLSGSMSGTKSEVTTQSAIALAECLEGTQISYRIVGFCNKGGARYGEHGAGKYHRYERLDTVVFKGYDDPLRVARGSIARLPEAVGGNNSDWDAVNQELYILSRRPEARKVLFVLSDGHVACHTDYDLSSHEHLIKKNINEYRKRHKVETIGIGVLTTAVKDIYPDYILIKNINDLSGSMFKKMTDTLFREVKG